MENGLKMKFDKRGGRYVVSSFLPLFYCFSDNFFFWFGLPVVDGGELERILKWKAVK